MGWNKPEKETIMKEFTKEQVEKVEQYLDGNGIIYVDLKFEILDHLLLEIEKEILKGKDFDYAFEKVKREWRMHFKSSSSIFLGYAYIKPKLVIEKMLKYGKKQAIKLYSIVFLMIFLIGFKPEIPVSSVKTVSFVVEIVLYLLVLMILAGYLKIVLTKQKTSYRFLYETQVLPFVLLPIMTLGSFVTKKGNIDVVSLLMLVIGVFVFLFGLKLYEKHFSILNRYSLK